MKSVLISILLFVSFVPVTAQVANCGTTISGNPVIVPVPVATYAEVGRDKREFFKWMVPSGNRLLCVFVPADVLPRLKNPAIGMDRYILVETVQAWDESKTEVTRASFEEIISAVKEKLSDSKGLNQTAQAFSEETSRKLKAIDSSKDVTVDKPIPIGTLFEKQDVFAFAMVLPVTSAGATKRVINASVLLRVRDRLLFTYTYSAGTDEASLMWAKQTSEELVQQVFTSNTR